MAHIFFADMETNTLNEFYRTSTGNGTIATSNEQAKTGTYSLKSNITLAGGSAFVEVRSEVKAIAEVYYRLYYYLPTATYDTLNINGDNLYFIIAKNEDWAIVWRLYIDRIAGVVYLIYDYDGGIDTVACPTRDAWHCVEIYHKRDAAAGAWQWWVDGTSEGSGAGINTGAKNAWIYQIGSADSNGMTGALYLDNIVIANSRIYELMGNIPQGNSLRKRVETPQGWIM